jgi:hypothetical protein
MISKALRIAVISDIHLGSKRNSTEKIIRNLDKYFSNAKDLAGLDIVFLAGDVFDELLSLDNPVVGHIKLWIARLLRRCHHLKIKVRVLKGTPFHDRDQSALFVTLNEINSKSGDKLCDLKYIEVLDIEYFEEYGMNVLYVPDEWGSNSQDCLDQVKALLTDRGLVHVDMAIMHGMFSYQLGIGLDFPHHDENEYLEIVQGPIFIGHVHTHSTFSRIVAQGSFDRLAHNEEEAKGYVRAILQEDLSYAATFIENKDAAIYKTITIQTEDVANALLAIEAVVKKVQEGANLRIEAHYANPILSSLSTVKNIWPMYNWSTVARGKESKVTELMIDHKSKYVPVIINRQTIKPLLLGRLQKLALNEAIMGVATTTLDEVLRL